MLHLTFVALTAEWADHSSLEKKLRPAVLTDACSSRWRVARASSPPQSARSRWSKVQDGSADRVLTMQRITTALFQHPAGLSLTASRSAERRRFVSRHLMPNVGSISVAARVTREPAFKRTTEETRKRSGLFRVRDRFICSSRRHGHDDFCGRVANAPMRMLPSIEAIAPAVRAAPPPRARGPALMVGSPADGRKQRLFKTFVTYSGSSVRSFLSGKRCHADLHDVVPQYSLYCHNKPLTNAIFLAKYGATRETLTIGYPYLSLFLTQ
jgi:hypothetical protein